MQKRKIVKLNYVIFLLKDFKYNIYKDNN